MANETVTASGLKYIDAVATAMKISRTKVPPARTIGGIIGPY